MTAIPHNYFDTLIPDKHLRISRHVILACVLLALTFVLRFDGKPLNTIFYDEAIYATMGREMLAGDFSQHPITWTYGSALYPAVASISNMMGGENGLRLLSAVLSTTTAICIFLTTLRLFGKDAALWAAALFALAGTSIGLGQMAVYDSLSVPLLAIALLCLVYSAYHYQWTTYLLLIAGCSAGLAVLAKYTAGLLLPPLLLVGVMIYLARGRSIFNLIVLVFPIVLILLQYIVMNFADLMQLVAATSDITKAGTGHGIIAWTILAQVGPILAVGALSILILPYAPFYRKHITFPNSLLHALVITCLAVSLTAVPLYHLLSGTTQSLWKHTVYMLVFFAPLAGYGLDTLIRYYQKSARKFRPIMRLSWAMVTLVVTLLYLHLSLNMNWGLRHSWPNVTQAVSYLSTYNWTRDTRLLAEQSAVYEYYFDLGAFDRSVWTNTFYMEYGGLTGADAMTAAIDDHYFDLVILDDYYTASINHSLEEALLKSGYTLVYRDAQPQALTTSQSIIIRIYQLKESRDVQTISTSHPV